MLDSFKMVLEKKMQAKKIMIEAKEKAEALLTEAQEEAEEVYKKTYQETIAQAKEKSIEIKDRAKMEAESEGQIFLERSKKQKEKIRMDTEKKFDNAVKTTLNEILS